MAPFSYLLPRIVRHFLPEPIVRLLLGWKIIIKPGLETRSPMEAVSRYQTDLAEKGCSLHGRRVLIFGYGGSYSVACGLLELGAAHVVLVERRGFPFSTGDPPGSAASPQYFNSREGHLFPSKQYFTVCHADVRHTGFQKSIQAVDLVLSSSVFEHLQNVEKIARALAALTTPDGVHLHYVDLRDHYFRYPFEMLCYSEATWRRWLNPTSNLNRLRIGDYRRLFTGLFHETRLDVLARDPSAFNRIKHRILPGFITGNDEEDSVTLLRVFAARPLSPSS